MHAKFCPFLVFSEIVGGGDAPGTYETTVFPGAGHPAGGIQTTSSSEGLEILCLNKRREEGSILGRWEVHLMNTKHARHLDMIHRTLPVPRNVEVFCRVQRVVTPHIPIALLTRRTVLAVPVVVASIGCEREGPFPHFDANSFSGLDELPRRNYMCRPWSSELMLDLNGAMRVSQAGR